MVKINLGTKQNRQTQIVLVGGCFDFIHYGHIEFLKKAKALGKTLIVALESDKNVRKSKGNNRPIHPQVKRQKMLEALRFVNSVIPLPQMNTDYDYRKLVLAIKPDIIAVTADDPLIEKKRKHAQSVGAKITVIPKTKTPSTSRLAKLLELE